MQKASEIARLDYEMTKAVIGEEKHKPIQGDKFQGHRDRILELRVELIETWGGSKTSCNQHVQVSELISEKIISLFSKRPKGSFFVADIY